MTPCAWPMQPGTVIKFLVGLGWIVARVATRIFVRDRPPVLDEGQNAEAGFPRRLGDGAELRDARAMQIQYGRSLFAGGQSAVHPDDLKAKLATMGLAEVDAVRQGMDESA